MPLSWYALHSKPRKEELLYQQLTLRSVDCFYPRVRIQPVNPRAAKVRAYFPGYVFVHVDLSETGFSMLHWLPGTTGMVTFGNEPATVPDALISTLRNKLDKINIAGGELFDGLKQGDLVEIKDGPFAGYEAIFDERLDGSERVRVLLKLLQKRQFPVELPSAQVQRMPPKTGLNK